MQRIVLIILLCSGYGIAQGWAPAGGRSRGMGDASVTLQDIWAYHHNPAALIGITKFGVGLSYENRFLLKELQTQSVALALPLKKGVISGGAQSFGYTQFRTIKAGLGYSLRLSEIFGLGVQMNLHQFRIGQGYGNAIKATGEVGLLTRVNNKWLLGFSLVNFSRVQLSSYQEDRLSTVMRIGSSYSFSNKLLVCVEGEKHVDFPLRGKAGLEYTPMENLSFRSGFSTQPIEINAGCGYVFKGIYFLDFGSAFTQQLGWSPNVSFTYRLK